MKEEKKQWRDKMSKRIAGVICLAGALGLTLWLFTKSIDVKIADPDTARSLINGLWIMGGSLFGLDLAGKVLKK